MAHIKVTVNVMAR